MITIEQLKDVKERTEALYRYLDIEGKKIQVEEEQLRTQAPGFWDDQKAAEAQMKKVKALQQWITGYQEVKTLADELQLSFDFYKDELVVITPNTEKYQKLLEDMPDDISWIGGEHLIMREEGSGTRKEAGKQLRAAGINLDKLKIIASIENQETIKKSVKQGMGISVISRLAAEDEVKYGDLLAFSIPKADQGRDINLVYNKNYQMSKSTERFVKIVKEIYGIEE